MNVKNNFLYIVAFFIFILLMNGCGGSSNSVSKKPSIVGAIVDNLEWYKAIDPNTSVVMNVEVPTPNDYDCVPYNDLNASPRPCTLEDVLNDDNAFDSYDPELHVIFYSDEFPSNKVNASMKQKGKSTRHAKQDSFRVKLDSKTDLYKGERTFQFNKSPYDRTRMKDKFWFDAFIGVPNFTSLRTRFVNLFIDGQDYGLFTHVEYVGKEYLLHRGWNKDDNLYKIQNFAFYPSEDLALDSKGNPLYPDRFDFHLEQKRGKNPKKLVDMVNELDKVWRDPVKFSKFFDKYFDRENYITWMAINIISSNKDTTTQNFYLLNPKYSDKFYFLPWDYDGAGYPLYRLNKWEKGLGFLWQVPLHKGFLSIKENRDQLNKKIAFLRAKYFTDARLQAKVDAYKKVVEPFIKRAPDDHLDYSIWKDAVDNLVPQIGRNLEAYKKELGSPMPFWQEVHYDNGDLNISWGRSVDLEGDKIVYDLKVAKDGNMSDIVFEENNISDTPPSFDPYDIYYSKSIDLSPGTYYLKVTAFEENNASSYQDAFDFERGEGETKYFGVLSFDVK